MLSSTCHSNVLQLLAAFQCWQCCCLPRGPCMTIKRPLISSMFVSHTTRHVPVPIIAACMHACICRLLLLTGMPGRKRAFFRHMSRFCYEF